MIAKHQITRKAPGQPGIILFQIENEYDFWPMNDKARVTHLTALANDALADGIDVPLISCETSQIPRAKTGPLRAAFNCLNFYPFWNVQKGLEKAIPELRAVQPDAPLATTELQGGWFAKVGGKLSQDQDGLTAAQIQNLTLYAWQLGDTITNYYMLFGGTNFDDLAGRGKITSYDYNAPIREAGGVDARYQRVWALGHMLQEHGPKLVRAQPVEIVATATDSDVEIAERRAADGSRYFFVRTNNRREPRTGTAQVKEPGSSSELDFSYHLEPFGSLVLYLPPGVNDAAQGEWLPKAAPEIERPTDLPTAIPITEVERAADPVPTSWMNVSASPDLLPARGVYGSHFVYYKVAAQPGATVTFGVPAEDAVVASASGQILDPTTTKDKTHISFTLPTDATELTAL